MLKVNDDTGLGGGQTGRSRNGFSLVRACYVVRTA